MEPIFTNLPPNSGGRRPSSFTEHIRETLRSRPGEWAIVHRSNSTSTASNWKRSHGGDGFEFTTRRTGEGAEKYSIFARYVGDEATR